MAYYDALVSKWATLTGTTASKLSQINTLTITGTVPTSFVVSGSQLLNCINWTEFSALTAAQQNNVLALCNNPSITGGSANASIIGPGMFLAYFSNHAGPTVLALIALAQSTVTPWWQANGYPGIFNTNDLVAAGNLT